METSLGEKLFTTLLILITLGSVTVLLYSLVTTETTSLPLQQGLIKQQS